MPTTDPIQTEEAEHVAKVLGLPGHCRFCKTSNAHQDGDDAEPWCCGCKRPLSECWVHAETGGVK